MGLHEDELGQIAATCTLPQNTPHKANESRTKRIGQTRRGTRIPCQPVVVVSFELPSNRLNIHQLCLFEMSGIEAS